MTTQQEKPTQPKRKPSSQPSLISNYFKRIDPPPGKSQSIHSSAIPAIGRNETSSDPARSSSPIPDEYVEDDRVSKRPRLGSPPSPDGPSPTTPGEERNALSVLMSPKVKEFRPAPESPRTARYKYLTASTKSDVENLSPEQLAKKKSLHEKFVQKLGRPDSLVALQTASQVEASAGEDEGDDEKEDIPAKKTLREKYAAAGSARAVGNKQAATISTKLTPLERQFVEIKKQYPDTLLLIEVGYKFRFFGEDAKVFRCRSSS